MNNKERFLDLESFVMLKKLGGNKMNLITIYTTHQHSETISLGPIKKQNSRMRQNETESPILHFVY